MKVGKELILFSIVSIVFLAGCTGGGGEVSSSSGVVITSFSPDIQTVDGGDVTFTAVMQNIGEKTASNIKVLFFGLSNEWISDSAAFNSKLDTSITTLAPADAASGLKGEEGSADLTATAPQGKGTDVTYDASARIFYDYTTESDTLLRFVKSTYLKTNPNVPKGIQSHSSTGGPLIINAVARTPTLSGDSTTGRIQFEIQNVGGGRVFTGGLDANNNPVTLDVLASIKITGLGSGGSCSSIKGSDVNLPSTRLAGGSSKIISCDIDVSRLTNFADRAIKVTVQYSYFTDSTTQVTVTKSIQETISTGGAANTQGCTPDTSCTTNDLDQCPPPTPAEVTMGKRLICRTENTVSQGQCCVS